MRRRWIAVSVSEGDPVRSGQDGDDPVLARALRAVGRMRALGLHFYGHFIGVTGQLPADGRARLELEGEPTGVGAAAVSPAALATLADLALSATVRSRVAPGARLGTVTLALQHPPEDVAGPIVADAAVLQVGDGFGTARCTLRSADVAIGAGQASFALLPAPAGTALRLTPWEHREAPTVVAPSLDDLNEREAVAVAAARTAGQRAAVHGTAVSQELLHFTWRAAPEGRSSGTLAIGPELDNRVGHVQGGVLYGAAVAAAIAALDAPEAVLADGYYQFLRPADGATLAAEGAVVRRGRSAGFVEVRLMVDDTLVGIGLFSFRLSPDVRRPRSGSPQGRD